MAGPIKSIVSCSKYVFKMSVSFGDIVLSTSPETSRVSSPDPAVLMDRYAADHRSQTSSFNGLIGSLEFFVVVLTFAVGVLLAPSLTPKATNGKFVSELFLVCFMITGFIVMICFYRHQTTLLRRETRSVNLKGRLVISGIVLFYIFSCILDFMYAIHLIRCASAIRICGGRRYIDHVMSIVFHLSRVIYLGAETVLCIAFRSVKYLNKSSTRYGILMLEATNLALWFDILLRESEHRKATLGSSNKINTTDCLGTALNSSAFQLECVYGNTSVGQTLSNIGPYLYPFPYEFSILVGQCLMKWFIQCGKPTSGPDTTDSSIETEAEATVDAEQNEPEPEASVMYSSMEYHHSRPASTDPISHSLSQGIGFLAGIILNIVYGILTFIALENKTIYLHFSICYWVSMILLGGLGYHCSRVFLTSQTKNTYKFSDYMFLFTIFGPLVYVFTAFFIIFKEYKNPDFESKYVLNSATSLILELVFAMSILTQIPLGFLAGRVAMPTSISTRNRTKIFMFKQIILHMAICNGTMWFLRTFSATEASGNTYLYVYVQRSYFDHNVWDSVYVFVLPLVLFFRFNSCVMFTCAYIRLTRLVKESRLDPQEQQWDILNQYQEQSLQYEGL